MSADTVYRRLDVVEQDTMDALLDSQPLPKTTSTDNGKVLKVNSGKWVKGAAPRELPQVTADDNGKVLMVVNGEWVAADLPSGD